MGADEGRRCQRGGAARTAGFGLDALEPRTLFSGSFHDLSGGLCIEPIAPGYAAESLADVRATPAASLDLSQTFRLHSLPGARHTIYLDFNGFTTTGTQWNTYAGRSSFTSPAYSTDGSAAFSTGELTNIQQIWQRVAEDFAPFNVNVTTVEPPAHALVRSGAGDTAWGIRVVVGGSSEEWLGVSAGGVAWIGSFNWNSDTPVFVFEDHLGNGNEKLTAEAISHEVGHALGLDHDGHFDHEHDADEEYYEGHGSGETGWAPLMGVGYYRHVTQWSRGQYAGATNPQDDLSIITTRNGFGYRADDTGDTLATATPLSVGGGASVSGLIERNTDVDVYAFSTSGGSVSFRVDPAERGPNLDVLAEILDAAGNVIAAANPTGVLSAHLNAALSAGSYYLRVSGAGEPNGAYTDYASLGQYTITGELQAAATPPTLSLNNTATYEGNGWARMSIILSEASDTPVSVVWGTTAGTARSARDFNGRAGYVVFQPGQVQKFIYVRLIDDRLRENTERMWVGLMNASGATIGRGWGSLYVLDNDPGAAARRAAQAKAAAAARAAAAASTPAAAQAWQLQRAQQSAAGFAWSAPAAGDDLDGQADDLLAHLPALA